MALASGSCGRSATGIPRYGDPFIVPSDVATFRTDLASIPWFFAWLVPGLGTHLPAVLLHDGLVVGPTEGKTHIGPDVDREEADRILRDAMASLGTPVVRRWLMWTAVILATAFSTLRPRWRWAPLVVGTLLLVGGLGVVATLDLHRRGGRAPLDGRPSVGWPRCCSAAPLAVVVPLVVSVLWGRLWRAAAIAGVALALLLHVTVVVAADLRHLLAPRAAGVSTGGRQPSAKANLEEADTSEGMYLPAE